ncbi:hypothetical protein BACCAP_04203 [Pseudoflavonifractor capillosus ATCC 29799]|uniref:Uncharacterized protein n=1 Tax=Pseudoflavonifractor capillosus ATCC 29799 TaxID=411467 RepID=A6P137_9FIRM|nr:hypothetical protein BACCAP_04203 [Pseudoflavonifractor capillosus ATCC 29799]
MAHCTALFSAFSAPRRRGLALASSPGLVGICQNNTSVRYGALYNPLLFPVSTRQWLHPTSIKGIINTNRPLVHPNDLQFRPRVNRR